MARIEARYVSRHSLFLDRAWAVTFTLPYLFYNANLGAQIGWIYGAGTLIAMAFVYFFIPRPLAARSKEINEMLEAGVPTRQWTTYVTQQERLLVDQSRHVDDDSHLSTNPTDLSPIASNGDDKKIDAKIDAGASSQDINPNASRTRDVEQA